MLKKAEEEVRKINEKTLLQKASLKKDFLKNLEDRSAKYKTLFIRKYNEFLSDSLSSTILQSKEMLLQIKNDLLLDFEKDLKNTIEQLIDTKYSKYIIFLTNNLKEVANKIGVSAEVEIIFNSKDLSYFKSHRNIIDNLFKGKLMLKESTTSMIGGFKLFLSPGKISYDYTLENLILKSSNVIEQTFSSSYTDVDLESFQKEFEKFITNKKARIEDYLKKYDEIRI